MHHWRIVLSLLCAAVIGIGVVALSGSTSFTNVALAPSSSSTTASVPNFTSTSTATASPELPASTTVAESRATRIASVAEPSLEEINAQKLTAAGGNLLKSVVNILCIPHGRSTLRAASGSGVIIDPRGLILTAAHVGQYFLLTDYPRAGSVSCVIRTGGPAEDAYTADLVYESPSWIENNPGTLTEKSPTGTGENDFAILAITGSADGTPLPASYPYVPLSKATPQVGEKVAIGAYAAQYLAGSQIANDLFPTIVFNPITDRFTFDTNSVDVISISGTAAAQEGSSGGGIADADGGLVGLITTSTISGDVSEHTLNAITPLHMRTSFSRDTTADLDSYLSAHDISSLIDNFKTEAAKLRKILINNF